MKHKIVEQWLEEYEFGKVRLVVQLENGNKFTQVITAVDKYGYNISIWEPTKEPKEPAPKVPEKYNNMQQLDKPPAPTVINLLKCGFLNRRAGICRDGQSFSLFFCQAAVFQI